MTVEWEAFKKRQLEAKKKIEQLSTSSSKPTRVPSSEPVDSEKEQPSTKETKVEKTKEECPYCGKEYTNLKAHLKYCPSNPENAELKEETNTSSTITDSDLKEKIEELLPTSKVFISQKEEIEANVIDKIKEKLQWHSILVALDGAEMQELARKAIVSDASTFMKNISATDYTSAEVILFTDIEEELQRCKKDPSRINYYGGAQEALARIITKKQLLSLPPLTQQWLMGSGVRISGEGTLTRKMWDLFKRVMTIIIEQSNPSDDQINLQYLKFEELLKIISQTIQKSL